MLGDWGLWGLGWVGAGGIVCSVLGGVFGGGLVGLGGARGVDMLLRVFWLLLVGFDFWNGGLALGCVSTQV